MADRIKHDAEISERYLKEKFARVAAYRWQDTWGMDDFMNAEARLARLFARHWKENEDADKIGQNDGQDNLGACLRRGDPRRWGVAPRRTGRRHHHVFDQERSAGETCGTSEAARTGAHLRETTDE